MNVKTMEGLAGASTSISMISTPMNVAKEAERKGDTDKMQRALGYAAGLVEQADEYGKKTSEGMEIDAKEAKEQEKLRQEKLIEARKAEREELEKSLEEKDGQTGADLDSAQISEEGKQLAEAAGQIQPDSQPDFQDVIYDSSGGSTEIVQEAGHSVDVSA